MNAIRHIDEARKAMLDYLQGETTPFEKAVLIEDIFGKMRLVMWAKAEANADDVATQVKQSLKQASGAFWTGEIWLAPGKTHADQTLYEQIWQESDKLQPNLGVDNRYRSKSTWFRRPESPPWGEDETRQGITTPIVAFYSFKGGVGRTTAMSAFAIQHAQRGEKVVVVDLDLDAPGAGTLLDPNPGEPSARWGVLDYLLEQPLVSKVALEDYYHVCGRPEVTREGQVLVFPAGNIDTNYLGKLARVDLEPSQTETNHPLRQLLIQIREELAPDWILLDLRAGLSDAAGLALSGLAHLHVLFGTTSEQSWLGLRLVLERLGTERVRLNEGQAECLLVQSMVPESEETAVEARRQFEARAEAEFRNYYYVNDGADEKFWYVRDMNDAQAPHHPASIRYNSRGLAFFARVDQVVKALTSDDYAEFAQRIAVRFPDKKA